MEIHTLSNNLQTSIKSGIKESYIEYATTYLHKYWLHHSVVASTGKVVTFTISMFSTVKSVTLFVHKMYIPAIL